MTNTQTLDLILNSEGYSIDSSKQLSSRRGAELWRVQTNSQELAVKFAIATSDDQSADITSLQQETLALSSIDALQDIFTPVAGRVQVHDRTIPYVIKRWIDGSPAKIAIRKQRDIDQLDSARFITWLARIYEALAPIHATGWAHGDIQPDHLIIPEQMTDKIILVDYGCSQSPKATMMNYRGGLVHFNAPELCRDILHSGSTVANPVSDVYSAAAAFFFIVFEELLTVYPEPNGYESMLKALSRDIRRGVKDKVAAKFGTRAASLYTKLLDPIPSNRPQNAMEVLSLIGTYFT